MALLFISTRACRSWICFSSWATRWLASATDLPRAATSSSSERTRSAARAASPAAGGAEPPGRDGSPFESFKTSWAGSPPDGTLSSRRVVTLPEALRPLSRSAGVERLLFPALVESPIPLTNGKGVFSASLAEWVVGAVHYFAKDFRRLVRNQVAAKWEEFAPEMIGSAWAWRRAHPDGYRDSPQG